MINHRLTDSSFDLNREVAELYKPFQCNASPLGGAAGNQSFNGLKKLSRNKSQHLLEAACKVARASFGGVGCLSSSGELMDNPAWGVDESVANELSESRWLDTLIQTALQKPEPTRLADVGRALPFGELPTGVPAVGSVMLFPLAGPGRLRGALYLARSPGQPAFGPEDEEAVLPISICLQEGNLVEEASLQAQLRLLNRVAQAAAGNLEMTAIFDVSLRELDRHLPMCVSAVWLAEADAPLSAEGVDQDRQKTGKSENEGSKLAGSHSAVPDAAVWLRLAAASTGQGIRAVE
ncbi:MAG TPA: GAF domain-containing protein, partial [Gemmataceae bacterium]|nr:GAF domain-containing protein [Gemmataceae bacterium]